MNDDPYGQDVLSGDWKKRGHTIAKAHNARIGLVVEHEASGFCGEIVSLEKNLVTLEDHKNRLRVFELGAGFLIDGQDITLSVHKNPKLSPRARTASGSFHVPDASAKVAMPSRIFVEGKHDAELVEKVWGDDLRVEGIVVEYLNGIDDLDKIVEQFQPHKHKKLGVLVDHLVSGSKESRIAKTVMNSVHSQHIMITGHSYVDIWQAVKATRLGLERWPVIPKNVSWKVGACIALGLDHETQTDIALAWKHILSRVNSFHDLEPELLAKVEQLIDFVTE